MSLRHFKDTRGLYGLKIDQHLIDEMKKYCLRNPRNETGGILIGKYSSNLDCAVVKQIEGPPEDSSAGLTWFYRGIKGLKNTLENLWSRERLHYLGEWHYHPYSSPTPSEVDHQYMKAIKEDSKVDCKSPLLVILGGDPSSTEDLISVTVYDRNAKPISLDD